MDITDTAILRRLLAGALLLLVATAAQATPKIQHWQLDNGARIYFVESHHLPMVQALAVFHAGSSRDQPATAGVAALTSALLVEGTADLDANAVADRFESLGAQYSADSYRDMARFSLRSLSDPEYLDPAVDLAGRLLKAPSFPEAGFQRERARALTGLAHSRQNPANVAARRFFEALYPGHPYALPPEGSEAGLAAASLADVRAFHQRYYVGRNVILALVGDLDPARARRIAQQLVGDLPAGEKPAPPPSPPEAVAKEVRIPFPSAQSHLLMGQHAIARGDPDYFPLYVGNYSLGGGGQQSRLFQEIREKNGLAYSTYSYFVPMERPGPFTIGLQTRNDQLDKALALTREQVRAFVADGPSAEELEAARKNLTGGFALRTDSSRRIAEQIAVMGFYNLPLDYLDRFIDRINAVTLEQVRDAWRRRVRPEDMTTVIVGGGG
ncbi:MAG: insulinase family protein [Gammaproteobacteria bacterium]|nr:insulinase family protein [Gammaproteobacteria bacterium]